MTRVTVFHASSSADIQQFLPLSHFGTLAAARDRSRVCGGAHLYTVMLDFSKVLQVPDFTLSDGRSGQHTWMRLVDQLHYDIKPRAITADQRSSVFIAGTPRSEGGKVTYNDQAACHALADILSKRWDVLSYRNRFEDAGSTSFVVLNPACCQITSRELLTTDPKPAARGPRP